MFHCGMVGVVFGSCLYLQEYEQGDIETKRQILSNLDKYGVKNCSWCTSSARAQRPTMPIQKMSSGVSTQGHCDACFSAVMLLHCMLLAHCLARAGSAIFKIEGVDESSLADRSQTLETISLNIFGDDSARLPLTAFRKEFLHKKKTFECIFKVLQWSYKILLGGVFPSCRHDGQPFTNSDSYRTKLAHKSIGIKACLAEFRADWACYKDVLDFQSWASTGYICWQCNVPKADLKKFDSHTFAKYLWAHSNSSNCFCLRCI